MLLFISKSTCHLKSDATKLKENIRLHKILKAITEKFIVFPIRLWNAKMAETEIVSDRFHGII